MTVRPVTLGQVVIDQFPVFGDDGYTKVTGVASFVPKLWKDAVPSLLPVTITEIGSSGEYRVSFTPDSVGAWMCEVGIPLNESIWFGEYILDKSVIDFGASMAEDGTTARFTVWGDDEHGRAIWLTAMSARIYDASGTLVTNLGSGIGPSADGTFAFNCLASLLSYNVPYYLAVVATNGTESWNGNCGFVRVK